MFKLKATAFAVAAGCAFPLCAQEDATMDEIRREIRQLKESYETRIQALEQRLKDAEAAKAPSPAAAAPAAVTPAAKQVTDNAFNPAMSLILQGVYGDLKESPEEYAVTGFADPEKIHPGTRGFSLGESELNLSANIDQLFYGNLLVAFEEGEVHVEEAWFQTLALGHGLTVKGGRFFSGIGYQNMLHPHAWDFFDAALVQRSFLGNNYGDDGVQATWIAPLPVYLELGAEVGAGRLLPGTFEEHSELAEVDRDKNGAGAYALFARLGGDIGTSNSYRVGVSYLDTSTDDQPFALADFDTRTGVSNEYSGDVHLYGVDLVWKWAPDGNPARRNFKLVAEWMQLERKGDLVFDVGGAAVPDAFKLRQSGWYVQGVYQFMPTWRVGLRYDQLDQGSSSLGANTGNIPGVDYDPERWSAMVDWTPSEFSRWRLQYSNDESR
ncbi:MAG TPA: TonB-dependent receptor, partial [Burkholderiales bacterium]|nr:TonB-dependent receptor [Burkholderiales bacterium]